MIALLARLVWMFLGPGALVLIGVDITLHGKGGLGPIDLAFVGALVITLLARWYAQRWGLKVDAYGEPSTPSTFRRYVFQLVLFSLVGWGVAHWIVGWGR